MKFNILKRSYRVIISLLIGFIFGIIFLKIFEVLPTEKGINIKSNTPFSYNSAISKASPAVVNIFSEQLVNNRTNRPRRNLDSIFGKKRNQINMAHRFKILNNNDLISNI